MSPIYLRVKAMREALGLSQEDLSQKSGVRRATISKVEAGGHVNLDTLEKLANALDVDASVLIVHRRRSS